MIGVLFSSVLFNIAVDVKLQNNYGLDETITNDSGLFYNQNLNLSGYIGQLILKQERGYITLSIFMAKSID